MCLQERNLVSMFFLSIITIGFYFIYWSVKTKNSLNCLGARVPTAFLIIIPIANFYFWYKYSEAFAQYINKNNNVVAYFLLMALLPFIGMFILQAQINEVVNRHA